MRETKNLISLNHQKIAVCALIALLLICCGAKTNFSQATGNSTPETTKVQTNDNDEALRRAQLADALERAQDEVRAARKYVAGLESSVRSKQKLIDALNEKDAKNSELLASLRSEINSLEAAAAAARDALEARRLEVEVLKTDLQKTRAKLKRARSFQKYLIGGAALAALIAILK